MPNNLPSINLIKNKPVPFFDKLMNWTLSIGRLIVIVTEVVAVAAFLYRFSLDEQLIELHNKIKDQQAIVSRLKNDEIKYRNLQDRLTLAANYSTKGIKTSQTIIDILNLVPSQILVSNLAFNKDKIDLNIDVVSLPSLNDFISSLKSYKNIQSISIDNIENKPSAGLSVSIATLLK